MVWYIYVCVCNITFLCLEWFWGGMNQIQFGMFHLLCEEIFMRNSFFFQLIILAKMLDLSLFYLIIHNALFFTMLLYTLFATWSFWICMYDIIFYNYKTKITCEARCGVATHSGQRVNFVLRIMNFISLFKVISILINFNWRRYNQIVLASISLVVIQ
jgi:hypothetical protein